MDRVVRPEDRRLGVQAARSIAAVVVGRSLEAGALGRADAS